MARILTVDDSRAIRSIVTKAVKEMGHEVGEAEHGEDGLTKLAAGGFDLVVLDVTMPILDGPSMLKRMREGGDKTPVLMLTSESQRAVIAECMKLGISDYVLKPFKPEELAAKVSKALGGAAPAKPGSKLAVDVLVVDDMDNVHKKLRAMLPEELTMEAVTSTADAQAACRGKVFKIILVDRELEEDAAKLLKPLALLQAKAAIYSVQLRTAHDADKEAKEHGWAGALLKPFDAAQLDAIVARHCEIEHVASAADNVVQIAACTGGRERLQRFFTRLEGEVPALVQKLVDACFDTTIVDIRSMPLPPEHAVQFVAGLSQKAKSVGLCLRLVGTPESEALFQQFQDTGGIPVFPSVEAAKAA